MNPAVPDFTLVKVLRTNAQKAPDRTAYFDQRRTRTYVDLERRTNQLARALQSEGVVAGDRVAYLGRSTIEFFELVFAAAKIRAVATPLNWRVTHDEVAFLLDDSGARVVVAEAPFAAQVPSDRTCVLPGDQYEAWIGDRSSAPLAGPEPGPGDVMLQSYTSGTTSMPKGTLFTHASMEHHLRTSYQLGVGRHCVILGVLPVHHVGGSVFGLFSAYNQGTLVIMHAFEPAEAPDLIARYGVTNFTSVPTVTSLIADEIERTDRDVSTLRSVVFGGAPMTLRELARIQRVLGVPLINAYGMTECPSISFMDDSDRTEERLGSIGHPYDGVEITIRDAVTAEILPPGVNGELWLRSAGCTPGYWNRDEATAELYHDGWMRTGDVANTDADGFIYLVDRRTDLIITGGENVYPAEVERVLVTHPEIVDVAVVGVPDDRWGECVAAFVVTARGSELAPQDVIDWARGRMPGFRLPRHVTLLDELPRNTNGKTLRRELREC